MAKCKDCLHNEVCKYGENRSNGGYCTGEKCKQFKDCTKYVEVVRCKDCQKHTDTKEPNVVYCKKFNRFMRAFDFCSYGERR